MAIHVYFALSVDIFCRKKKFISTFKREAASYIFLYSVINIATGYAVRCLTIHDCILMHLCYLIETHFRLSIPTSRCLRISRDTFRVCQHSSFEHFHSLRTTMLVLFHFPQRSPFSPATNGIVSGLQSYVTCMVCNSNSYQSYRSNTFKAFAAFRLSWPFVLLLLYACWSQHTFILFASVVLDILASVAYVRALYLSMYSPARFIAICTYEQQNIFTQKTIPKIFHAECMYCMGI